MNIVLHTVYKIFFLYPSIAVLFFLLNRMAYGHLNSIHEIKIAIPKCDYTNPNVKMISNVADWNSINDTKYEIFCVKPMDYYKAINKPIQITSSGTETKRRYLILDNGNNLHPGKLLEQQQANVQLAFDNAHYWIVDRISARNIDFHPIQIHNNSSNNVFNRLLVENFTRGIVINEGTHSNTIQNSRIGSMTDQGLIKDYVCVALIKKDNIQKLEVKNTHIINNEIYNCNDGFQTVRSPASQLANFEGTIVDGNSFYNTNTLFSDCYGKKEPTGKCSCAENGIDIKAGSDNPNNPLIISNNMIWGYQKTDTHCGGSGDPGSAIVIHYGTNNSLIKNNVIFNSAYGIFVTDKGIFDYSLASSKISHNLLYNIGVGNTSDKYDGLGITTIDASDVDVSNNIINKSLNAWLHPGSSDNPSKNMIFKCNIAINSELAINSMSKTSIMYDNSFFKTPLSTADARSYLTYSDTSETSLTDIFIKYDQYTNHPKNMTLKSAKPGQEKQSCIDAFPPNKINYLTITIRTPEKKQMTSVSSDENPTITNQLP